MLDERQLLAKIRSDERFFIELCLNVTDKQTNRKVPFKFNAAQDYAESKRTNFDMYLKARKMGFSTRIIASDIWACAFQPNQHAILLAHDMDSTQKLLHQRVLPMLANSVYKLKYEPRQDGFIFPDLGNRYYIGTAGTRKFGRGSDVTRYHLSEYAHWQDPELITGVEEACIDGAVGRIETTANGTNFFYLDWKRARAGKSRYNPIFCPWYLDPSYCIADARISDLSEDEQKLMVAYGISIGQIAWRRKKLRDMSRPELFPQEYPICAEEAFLTSGRMVFDWAALARHELECVQPKWRGILRDNDGRVQFEPLSDGALSVWHAPVMRHQYVIGADVAEGQADGCYSAAFVLDVNSGCQVAEWHGHVAPDVFGEILCLLGWYYNNAILCPESWPGCGMVTTQKILDMRYTNLHKRPAKANRPQEQRWGWETTSRTKPQMIHALAACMRDYRMKIYSQPLLDELRSIVYDDRQDITVQAGSFSDRVIAAAIAWSVAKDIAASPGAEPMKFRQLYKAANASPVVSVPKWQGPIYGVRNGD